jgi:hypothetical protein
MNKTCCNTVQVDGTADSRLITEKFAAYFESTCSPWSINNSENFKKKYIELKSQYEGCFITHDDNFDVEVISTLVQNMANGKAAGLDKLSAEHIN